MEDEPRGEQLVYGDFEELLGLKVHGKIDEIGLLSHNLNHLDRCLFMGYVSYVLSRAGYYDVTLYDDSRYHYNEDKLVHEYGEEELTTDFDQNYWVSYLSRGLTGWTEELRMERDSRGSVSVEELEHYYWWTHNYEHIKTNEKLAVVFIPVLTWKLIFYRDPEDDEEKPWVNIPFNPAFENFLIIKPSEYRKAKQNLPDKIRQLRETLPKLKEKINLASIDEFTARIIPDAQKKNIVISNWVDIRNKVFEEFMKEYPLLVFALEKDRLIEAEDSVRKSRREFEDNQLKEAVEAAAFACEAILNVFYRKNFGKSPVRLTLEDLISSMTKTITEELCEEVVSDLRFIKKWRNLVLHPQEHKIVLEKKVVLQVIARAEMCVELFKNILNPYQP